MSDGKRKPARYRFPVHLVTNEDQRYFRSLHARFKRSKHRGMYDHLIGPTLEQVAHMGGMIPKHQRSYRKSIMEMILREIRRGAWCSDNGTPIGLCVNRHGHLELFQGQHRLAAWCEYVIKEGGTLPDKFDIYITDDPESYQTCDVGAARTVLDIAHMRERVRVAGGVRAGILFDEFNFGKAPKLSPNEWDHFIYKEAARVSYARSLPQSSGGSTIQHALAGCYAAALRIWRIYGEKYSSFFEALIRGEHSLEEGGRTCPQLRDAVKAISKFPGQRSGEQGKVMATWIALHCFRAYLSRKDVQKKYLRPPEGRDKWPTTMPEGLPFRDHPVIVSDEDRDAAE